MASFLRRSLLRRSLSKYVYLLFVSAILVPCIIYINNKPMSTVSTENTSILQDLSYSTADGNTSQMNANFTAQKRKVVLAFRYAEQLTMATNNLLQLSGFAAFGGRQIVVPFVSDSFFHGIPTDGGKQTLELYYNITTLNDTLRSHKHGTFISWEEFQNVCKGRLDVLVHLDYARLGRTKTFSAEKPFIPCREGEKVVQGLTIGSTICVNVFALDSGERFENEAVKKLPCVGFMAWAGSDRRYPYRAQFDLKPVVSKVLSSSDIDALFNSKFLNIAQDFIAKNLPPQYISVHIRAESIIWNGGSIPLAIACTSNLTAHVQKIMNANNAIPVFLATDFSEFGSSSRAIAKNKHKIAPSLTEILSPLKAITFRPSEYGLNDHGAVAIVEMNILASGKHLVVLGGGSFQNWIVEQFLKKNGNDRAKVNDIPWK